MALWELPVTMVEILDERDADDGWTFDAQVIDASGGLSRCSVRLSWADYNLWSPSGADTPANVVRAVVEFLASPRVDRRAGRLVRRLDRATTLQ